MRKISCIPTKKYQICLLYFLLVKNNVINLVEHLRELLNSGQYESCVSKYSRYKNSTSFSFISLTLVLYCHLKNK